MKKGHPNCKLCNGVGAIWVDLSEIDCDRCKFLIAAEAVLINHRHTFEKLAESEKLDKK